MTETLQRILSLPPAERDAMTAEKVMGWKCYRWTKFNGAVPDGYDAAIYDSGTIEVFDGRDEYFRPSTDANDDYSVLRHCREKWGDPDIAPSREAVRFSVNVRLLWESRRPSWGGMTLCYRVGDYAIAALATVVEMEETT
jgi:hypothetical protein